jgi:hypothetical protein
MSQFKHNHRNLVSSRHFIIIGLWLIAQSLTIIHAQEQTPSEISFAVIGDFGNTGVNAHAVSLLINNWIPDFIITIGDNAYGDHDIDDQIGAHYSQYIGDYAGNYGDGSETNRFFPVLGNHDYSDGGGLEAYESYFTLPGKGISSSESSNNERYYDFIMDDIHFFVVNSNSDEPDGVADDSIQAHWLQNIMSISPYQWKVVLLHHSPFSSDATHGGTSISRWPFEAWGADAVLSGHAHTYERIMRDDNNDGYEIPYFVVGNSGRSLHEFTPDPKDWAGGSQVRYNAHYGALLVKASSKRLTFEGWSLESGSTLVDSYTIYQSENCTQMYNDLGFIDGQVNKNITFFTSTSGNSEFLNEGNLVHYESGNPSEVVLKVIGGHYNVNRSQATSDLKGDAAHIFEGRIDPSGTLTYHNDRDKYIVYLFAELDTNTEYTVVFYTNYNGFSSVLWERASLVSIMGAESFINKSTSALDNTDLPVFSGLLDSSTRYPANNPDGQVVRFDNIHPGEDNTFALVVAWDGIDNTQSEGYYGLYGNALMLEACKI